MNKHFHSHRLLIQYHAVHRLQGMVQYPFGSRLSQWSELYCFSSPLLLFSTL